MKREKKLEKRFLLAVVALAVFGTLTLGAPAAAQSGVVMGDGETILHLLDNNGGVAVDFDVDDVFTNEQIVIGRADTTGLDEMYINLVLVDGKSTLAADDPSVFLGSSQAEIRLGSGSASEPGEDGDLYLEDGFGVTTININGVTGNIEQLIDNVGPPFLDGNGAVKAWAIIDVLGNVVRCWNCNTSSSQTQRLDVGDYEVDFTIIGAISNRPVLAVSSCPVSNFLGIQCELVDTVTVSPRFGDDSSFFVRNNNSDGDPKDGSFTIVVF